MSKQKVCLFDDSKSCPVQSAVAIHVPIYELLDHACNICPIHERIMIEARKEKKKPSELVREALAEESS